MTTAYERDMAQARAAGRTAQVQVFAPCSCSACTAGRRWFFCERPTPVANYMCSPRYVDCPDVPAPEMVSEIAQQHPGCSLVYLD